LHGDPRFTELQARIASHYARERRELERVLRA
jgi:hypothetical protein